MPVASGGGGGGEEAEGVGAFAVDEAGEEEMRAELMLLVDGVADGEEELELAAAVACGGDADGEECGAEGDAGVVGVHLPQAGKDGLAGGTNDAGAGWDAEPFDFRGDIGKTVLLGSRQAGVGALNKVTRHHDLSWIHRGCQGAFEDLVLDAATHYLTAMSRFHSYSALC